MKRKYNQPFVKKVSFSYEEQVVAFSGYHPGNVDNRDDTGACQFSGPCNLIYNASAGVTPLSLNDCWKKPFAPDWGCSE